MENKLKVYVAGVEMITPIGGNAEMTAAAVSADSSGIKETTYFNARSKAIRMALIPEDAIPELNENLTSLNTLHERMLRIAHPALTQLMEACSVQDSLPLFLSVPETVPGFPTQIDDSFLDNLILQTEIPLNRNNSRIFYSGRAGGIEAIEMAFKYFESTGNDYALVGGVDSCADLLTLGFYDKEDRILTEETMDAFAPGEAAGFLLLASEQAGIKMMQSNNQKKLPAIFRPGLAVEPGHRYSQEPYKGDGLSNAFRFAMENSPANTVSKVFSSLNGESFGAKEYGVAMMRNKPAFSEDVSLEHPADCFGDIGAAFGTVLVGLACYAKQGDYLCYSSSEAAPRAAVRVKCE